MSSDAADPIHAPARLRALDETQLLDALPQESLDRFTRIASRSIGAPVALVSLVDPRRQFFASAVGLPEPWASQRETPLTHSFCALVVSSGESLIVTDAANDPRVQGNLAISDLGVQAYAGKPIRTHDAQVLGSFCVIDGNPRIWTEHELALLDDLCGAVTAEVELRRMAYRYASSERQLAQLNDTLSQSFEVADVRARQAVHDLRTPLSVVALGLQVLRTHAALQDMPEIHRLLERIERNAKHTSALVSSMAPRASSAPPPPSVVDARGVAAQLALDLSTPALLIRYQHNAVPAPVALSDSDLRRCMENLLSNARRFARSSILLDVHATESQVEIAVDDDGPGLPSADAYERAWARDVRFHDGAGLSGSGLGLSIVREIVVAAGGHTRAAQSELGGARFVLVLPRSPAG